MMVDGIADIPPIQSVLEYEIIKVEVDSFGYLHRDPPTADVVLDLRTVLHNPAADPRMRELTGLYPVVVRHVLATPGAFEIGLALYLLTRAIMTVRDQPPGSTKTTVAIGCAGGRHRSVVFANQLVHRLRNDGIGADVHHLDILRPVVDR